MNVFTKMRYSDLVTESPQRVPPTNFIFDDGSKNRAFAIRMAKKEVGQPLEDTPDYRLFQTGDIQRGWLIMINKHDKRTDFAMRFTTGNRPWLKSFVSANVAGIDRGKRATKDLVARMFFDVLLKKYGTIVSDRKQTANGEGFWRRQMDESLRRGYRVGLANMNTQNIAWFDSAAGETLTDWIDRVDAYGVEHRYQARRFVIITASA